MKTKMCALAAGVFLATHGVGMATPKHPSKISEFKGRYSGTVLFNSGGTFLGGTATGTISASKKAERGTLNLSSVINSGGTTAVITETYNFQKRSFTYFLNLAGPSAVGSGSAGISKKSIHYSGVISSDGSSLSIVGSIRKTGRRGLTVTETLSGSGTALVITYKLRKRGK